MKLEDAKALAQKVCEAIAPLCERVEVAGSIRRERPEVNDIDIVAIPTSVRQRESAFGSLVTFDPAATWKTLIPEALMKSLKLLSFQVGQELLRLSFRESGMQVDFYRARPETWGIILLIRTGSKEHNVKLCSLARVKGLKLSACEGLVSQEGFGQVLASNSEEEIFARLGLDFVEPKDREA